MFLSAMLALTTSAHAYIYLGTPEPTFHLEVPNGTLQYADATVTSVRVHNCGGGYDTFPVNDDVDLVAGFSVEIDPGDLCGISVQWGSDVDFSGVGFDATYDEPYTSVTLDGSPSTVTAGLTPFEVVSGTMPGMPRLVVTVE